MEKFKTLKIPKWRKKAKVLKLWRKRCYLCKKTNGCAIEYTEGFHCCQVMQKPHQAMEKVKKVIFFFSKLIFFVSLFIRFVKWVLSVFGFDDTTERCFLLSGFLFLFLFFFFFFFFFKFLILLLISITFVFNLIS